MLNIVEKYQIFFNNALLTVFEYKCSSIVSNYVENCDVEYCCKKQLNFQDLNAFRSPFTIIGKILTSSAKKCPKTQNFEFLVFYKSRNDSSSKWCRNDIGWGNFDSKHVYVAFFHFLRTERDWFAVWCTLLIDASTSTIL